MKKKKVLLTWQTATELNNDYFEVQRAADGKTWEAIGKVKGAGNSNALLDYNFTDKKPLEGINFYRLLQVDFDRQSEYSPIISINYEKSSLFNTVEVQLYPNPTGGSAELFVRGLVADKMVSVKVIDVFGRVHDQVQITGGRPGKRCPCQSKSPACLCHLYFRNSTRGHQAAKEAFGEIV